MSVTSRDTLREGMALALQQRLPLDEDWASDAAGWLVSGILAPILDKADSAEAAEARADRLPAEVEALREALKPFAEAIKVNDNDTISRLKSDDHVVWIAAGSWSGPAVVTVGHFRAARIALARAAVKAETEGSDPLSPARKEDGDA